MGDSTSAAVARLGDTTLIVLVLAGIQYWQGEINWPLLVTLGFIYYVVALAVDQGWSPLERS